MIITMAAFGLYGSLLSFAFLFFVLSVHGIIIENYTQVLDHFGGKGPNAHLTFPQRFVIFDDHWGGAQNKSPILVFFGAEAPIMNDVGHVGVLLEAAPRLQALTLYIEHRFYGMSVPNGSIDNALASPKIRSFLTIEQALADFAAIITSLKKNLSALDSPVIVTGASYGGLLATWFRLKYPHIAIGALASSAPILFYEDVPAGKDFCSIVSKDFEHVDGSCSEIIRQSWGMIDEIASQVGGLGLLTKTFNLCRPLPSSFELKTFLAHTYSFAAQYNGRDNYWINAICSPIVEVQNLRGIADAVTAINSNQHCIDLNFTTVAAGHPFDYSDNAAIKAWTWQLCTEIVIHKRCAENNTLLIPREAFENESKYVEMCREKFGVLPQLDRTLRHYGSLELIKATSNIIFSNGLMDPYSGLGILDDISDTIRAVNTEEGSHCLDMGFKEDDDPKWLVKQRRKEIHILHSWINGSAPKKISLKQAFSIMSSAIFLVYFV